MGKMIQCDVCNKLINPHLDSYSILSGKDYNYSGFGYTVHGSVKVYLCQDCGGRILDVLNNGITKIRKESQK